MAKHGNHRRLTLRLMAVTICAGFIALFGALMLNLVGQQVVERHYCAPERKSQRAWKVAADFRQFVRETDISSVDAVSIANWNRRQPYVRLLVFSDGIVIRSDQSSAELVQSDSDLLVLSDSQEEDTELVPVNFSDGTYMVQILEFSQEGRLQTVRILSVTLAVITFFAIVLLYHRRVTMLIGDLAQQVRTVSHGDLTLEIKPATNDELGDLARDVDGMRLSILDKLHREEAAWKANSQLITAISHDIRTPLTTLLGYLELLETQRELPEQTRRTYLNLCRAKANTLKELTEELFSYSLLFGKPVPETELKEYDGVTLLAQILGESNAELLSAGYEIDMELPEREGSVETDAQLLLRVFGNLYSNLRKYADKTKPIRVQVRWEGDFLVTRLENHCRAMDKPVESTRIGLQTAAKLLEAMGGLLVWTRAGSRFAVTVCLREL